MYAQNRYRTNQYSFIPPDEPVGIQPIRNVVPKKFELHQNFQNPFNSRTKIKIGISTSGNVSLKVYDIAGREIASLVNNIMPAGRHAVAFNAADLSSGIYFCTMKAGSYQKTLRMALVK